MKHICLFFSSLLLAGLVACGGETPSPSPTEQPASNVNPSPESAPAPRIESQPMTFDIKEVGPEGATAAYPVMSGGNETARTAINTAIEKTVKGAIGDFGQTIETALEGYLKEAAEYEEEWDIDVSTSTPYQGKSVISLTVFSSSYSGGAHPNSDSRGLNLDPATGKELTEAEIIIDKAALTALAEKKFREQVGLKPNESINAEHIGYTFDNNKFVLASNITFTKEGLMLAYDAYEIAPYVMGPTDLLIPYAEVGGMVKELW